MHNSRYAALAALLVAACESDGGSTARDGGVRPPGDAGSGTPDATQDGATPDGVDPDDRIAPTIRASNPTDGATDLAGTVTVSVTFSEPMQEQTLVGATFELTQGDVHVAGAASYADDTLTFTPAAVLAPGLTYAASVSTAARDRAGNALLASHSWTFTTSATGAHGPAPVLLANASLFTLLARIGIASTPPSAIVGNVGITPETSAAISGFALTRAGATFLSAQVDGGVLAPDNDAPTPATLTAALGDAIAAYDEAAARSELTFDDLAAGVLGGSTLTPGLYRWPGAVSVATDVTLSGGPNDVWIFQLGAALNVAAAARVVSRDGAQAKNVFWQVVGAVNLGAGAHLEGVVLAKTTITLGAGASVTGRLLTQGDVALDKASVSPP